jgi:hypothetical protein
MIGKRGWDVKGKTGFDIQAVRASLTTHFLLELLFDLLENRMQTFLF